MRDRLGVIDFTVIGDDPSAIARHHGLRARGREIHDGKPPVPNSNASRNIAPQINAVRPAIGYRVDHRTRTGGGFLRR